MKKLSIVFAIVLSGLLFTAVSTQAQWAASGNDIYNTNTGNVGIGDGTAFTPGYLFEAARAMIGPSMVIHNLTGGSGGAGFTMIDDNFVSEWRFKAIFGGGFKIMDKTNNLNVIVIEQASASNSIYIKAGGNVGIGETNPTVKLAVNGKINCKEVEVTLSGWSDFVFKPGYELPALYDVEAFINENQHLPGVPSEATVLSEGTNLGEMDAILLQKIEELTLYVIDLQKQIQELKTK